MVSQPPGPSFRPFRQERRQSGQDGDQEAHEEHRSGIPMFPMIPVFPAVLNPKTQLRNATLTCIRLIVNNLYQINIYLRQSFQATDE